MLYPLWHFNFAKPIESAPIQTNGNLYLNFGERKLVSIAPHYYGKKILRSETYAKQAADLVEHEEWDDLPPILDTLFKLEPGNAEGWFFKALYLEQKNGSEREKQKAWAEAVRLSSSNPQVTKLILNRYSKSIGAKFVNILPISPKTRYPQFFSGKKNLYTIDPAADKLFCINAGTVQMMLQELNPGWLMPGTNLEAAIRKGMQLFKNSGGAGKYSVMILMSDGEELEAEAVNAAKEAAELGIRIYTVGIGSREGVPIPVKTKNGEVAYKKDMQGNIVTTRLEDGTLQEIANVTGGLYFYANPSEFQLQKVLTEIATLEKKDQATDRMENYQDRYQIFLGLAALLFLVEALVSERGRRRRQLAGRFS